MGIRRVTRFACSDVRACHCRPSRALSERRPSRTARTRGQRIGQQEARAGHRQLHMLVLTVLVRLWVTHRQTHEKHGKQMSAALGVDRSVWASPDKTDHHDVGAIPQWKSTWLDGSEPQISLNDPVHFPLDGSVALTPSVFELGPVDDGGSPCAVPGQPRRPEDPCGEGHGRAARRSARYSWMIGNWACRRGPGSSAASD